MRTAITIFTVLFIVFMSIVLCHAEELTHKDRIKRAEFHVTQTYGIMQRMFLVVEAMYLETHTQEEFDELIFADPVEEKPE